MSKKSLIPQIIMFLVSLLVIFQTPETADLFKLSDKFVAWSSVIAFALTILLQSPILSTGTWPAGWDLTSWVINGSAIIIQVLNATAEKGLVSAALIAFIVSMINAFTISIVRKY